ncbi:hypothetical protein BC835DRAFT_485768 [Cytidiella melzeri]|nr:hypothetical protein BC835DRAFT_485768 [Cytidiella melzeri]
MQTPTYILKTVRDPQSTLWGLTCADYNAEAIARLEVALDYLTSDLTRPLDATEALALCCIIARLAASVGTCVSYGVSGGTVHCWRPVFNILADLLRKCKGYTHRSLSDVCWTSIAKIDEAWFQPSSSRSNAGPPEHDARLQQFKESDSAAGDYFCSVLMTLTFHNDLVGESWRARRLSGMTDFEREELERRGEAEAILERECRSA